MKSKARTTGVFYLAVLWSVSVPVFANIPGGGTGTGA